MQKIISVLEDALQELKCDTELGKYLVMDAWDGVVGERIAGQTHTEGFKNGVLFVRVSTSAWMNELEAIELIIIERLNKKLAKKSISQLQFTLGEIPPPKVTEATNTEDKSPDIKVDEGYLERIKSNLFYVKDSQVRKALSRIMDKDARLRRSRGN